MTPSDAANSKGALTVRRLPIEVLLMVSSKHLLWRPYRAYRGTSVYVEHLDRVLSEGAQGDRKAIYSGFPHPSLGLRRLDNSNIDRVTLILFTRGDLAVFNVYLKMPDTDLVAGHVWPMYDLRHDAELADEDAELWQGPAAPDDASFMQFSVNGAATLNLSSLERSLELAGVPFETDFLAQNMEANWSSLGSVETRRWRPLADRLR